jgi:hypothetical protein
MLPVAGEDCRTFYNITLHPTADSAVESAPVKTQSFSDTYVATVVRTYPVAHVPIPAAARWKVCVYGRSLAGIAGSNPAGGLSLGSVVCCQV